MSQPEGSAPDTIVLVHGFWVTPRSWEHWIAHYEAQGLPRPRARLPRLRGRGRGAQRRPVADRGLTVPADHRALRVASSASSTRRRSSWATRRAASFTQIVLDHGFGAAGVAINSAPTEGVSASRSRRSRRRSRCSRTPPTATGRRLHVRAVALRVHQQLQRGAVARALRALPHPGVGIDLLGQRAGQHPSRPRTTLRRLPQRRPGAAAVHLRQRGPPDAAEDPAVQRQALQVRHVTEIKEFEGPHLLPAQDGLGGGRRLRAGLGARATRRRPAADQRVKDVRLTHIGGPTVADRGRRLAAADRSDVRPARPQVLLRLGHGVAQARRAGDRARPTCRRSTRSCSATTTTATTSTPPAARCCRRPARS